MLDSGFPGTPSPALPYIHARLTPSPIRSLYKEKFPLVRESSSAALTIRSMVSMTGSGISINGAINLMTGRTMLTANAIPFLFVDILFFFLLDVDLVVRAVNLVIYYPILHHDRPRRIHFAINQIGQLQSQGKKDKRGGEKGRM